MLENQVNQVKKVPVSQHVTQQLIDLIMNGTISMGEKLPPERKLMEMFGVGRSSLREAIRALVALGLVEVRVPEGTFVSVNFGDFFTKQLALMSKISFENTAELVEARIAIETDIAELAAVKVNNEDLQKLDGFLLKMKEAENNEDFLKADLGFHTTLGEVSRNSFMIQVMRILRETTAKWINKVIQIEESKELAITQHENIFNAIKKKEPKEAAEAMFKHLEFVSELLMKMKENERK